MNIGILDDSIYLEANPMLNKGDITVIAVFG